MTLKPSVVSLKAPVPADRARVREIVEDTGVFRPEEVEIALEVFDGATEEPGVDYAAIGAYEDDYLVGFACYGPTPCTTGTWDLYWIAVDPATHRHGIGRKLAEVCERMIIKNGGRLVVAETSSRSDYGPTRAFYEALGYGVAARVAEFYAPQDDLVLYTKRLS